MIKQFIIFDKTNNIQPLGILIEFEDSGKVVQENKNSLTIFDSLDCFLLTNQNYLVKEI